MVDPEAFAPAEEQFVSSVSADLAIEPEDCARARPAEAWRQEVTKRLDGYRAKRSKKRLAGEFSMNLDFGPPLYASAVPASQSEPEAEEVVAQQIADEQPAAEPAEPFTQDVSSLDISAPAPEAAVQWEEVVPEALPELRPPVRAPKLIEFPRPAFFPEFEDPHALAEPVIERPRILDVPEEVPTEPPPFNDVELGPEPEPDEPSETAFELPLRVAGIPRRLTASILDGVLVSAAIAGFAAIVSRFGVTLPHTKPVLGLAAAVPVIFWAVYQYIFLVHAAATPGMRVARIRLSTFEGTFVRRRMRRVRAIMLVLSGLSLALGFIWAFFDEDTLCWHDKMTRTYLTRR